MKENTLDDGIRVCICGGGNAAHVMAGLFSSGNNKAVKKVSIFSNFSDTAEKMRMGVEKNDGIKVHMPDGKIVIGKPDVISGNAADVIPDSNLIIMPVPSMAYESLLTEIEPYIASGTIIGATPGMGGFDWVLKRILRKKYNDIIVFSMVPMPWNCRILEYGQEVEVRVQKTPLSFACNRSSTEIRVKLQKIFTEIFGLEINILDHFLGITLFPANAVIHPARLYGLFRDYKEGKVYTENPLFYEDMDDFSADCIQRVSDELQTICKKIEERSPVKLLQDIRPITESISSVYPGKIEDLSSLKQVFRTNSGYKGFRTPMKESEGGWIPDFENRYFTEDIPHGLCIYKGIAEILEVETPMMDIILNWTQEKMGKEYLINNKLVGKDIKEANVPQSFDINTLTQLINTEDLVKIGTNNSFTGAQK
ncbi:MAG: NAD/NADP octopine/nopaline dehydrogenase family protein [Spirochaetales bacterium]|nr:NAD/NADP octopine/nopaline dehydrogenase family protein [Spirochaetales bacterium]